MKLVSLSKEHQVGLAVAIEVGKMPHIVASVVCAR